ncbi:MAG: metallophosphoesterase [Ignavibacteriales bacterium]|nr:metallophosphoesterase [Ignavibacteriales bacterium]
MSKREFAMNSYKNKKTFVSFIQKNPLSFLIIFTFLLVNYNTVSSQNSKSNSSRFLVVSDWGGSASNDQKAVAKAMAHEADKIGAQFVVTVGDNYHVDGISSATDSRWKTEFEDVYDFSSLQIPWYPSLGNHDYRGNVGGEIEYSKLSTRWKLPARYYAQTEKIDDSSSVLIVHLDTSPFIEAYREGPIQYHLDGQNTKKQIFWLDSVLTATTARWTIVVGHHSVYAAASNKGNTEELINDVLPILTKHRVPLYICGHYHVLQHLKNGKTDFVVCGGGAKFGTVDPREDVVFGSGSLGFLSITVTVNDLQVKIINDKNVTLHSFQIPDETTR